MPPLTKLTTKTFALCLTTFTWTACSSSSEDQSEGGGARASTGGSRTSGGTSAGGSSTTTPSGGSSNGMTTGGSTPSGGSAVGGTAPSPSGGQSAGGSSGASGGASSGSPGTPVAGAGTGGASSSSGGSTSGGSVGSGGNGGSGGSGGKAGSAGASSGSGGASVVSCPSTALAPGNSTRMVQSGGKSRSYVLHVPSGYDGKAPVPLLVDFHGHGGTGESQRNDSPYPKVVDSEHVITAFPTAIGDWNMGPCCADDVDDIGFARDLVAAVEQLACIDPKRVYASGFSMGGAMSHQLACRAADVFAAVAPAAFDLLEEHLATCKPQRPITVIAFRGTNDTLSPYDGGLSDLVRPIHFLGAVGSMKKWAELNGCTGNPADLGNNCQGYTAAQCPGGVEVQVCSKMGGGHEQGNATLGWPVLKRHQLP
jgi:polyhydroxybutyrate depolymerase